uniref:Predicted nucleotide-binding protein containing TIR-like domain-containing protein n=1 Tax=Candidatus Kentrum sp. UNK TaxID=2126344 RepID=A0A451AUK8_9GAMM|nr:MAG: Predicted nucleotide-binding protein containing TIR-like domain-containing protein [Candidatus Kentron sp. UNK]VFK69740.1 MAG: Predicted nucleotide-binding protein containing TIR-like domain-containing protein [Candidatus Kentron sp. UNK]
MDRLSKAKMKRLSKAEVLQVLRRALSFIPSLEQHSTGERVNASAFERWHGDTEIAIAQAFGDGHRYVGDFYRISYNDIEASLASLYYGTLSSEEFSVKEKDAYLSGLDSACALLQSMIEEIEKYWQDDPTPPQSRRKPMQTKTVPSSKKIFIIHGRDDGTKETVARFIEKLGLEPIILHEQANRGRSIIDKFEQHAEETAFAIALLTPDDVGGLQGSGKGLKPRARQNVIFELGWFLGRLGRRRVCALKKGDVEEPSDWKGVLYIDLDAADAWRMQLVKELKSAGFPVDANLAL